MEGNWLRFHSEDTVSSVLEHLLQKAYSAIHLHKAHQKVSKYLPDNYLAYMHTVEETVKTHREPRGAERRPVTITEPDELVSLMSRPHFDWVED